MVDDCEYHSVFRTLLASKSVVQADQQKIPTKGFHLENHQGAKTHLEELSHDCALLLLPRSASDHTIASVLFVLRKRLLERARPSLLVENETS